MVAIAAKAMDFISEKLDAMVTVTVSVEILWNEKYEIVCTMLVIGWMFGIATVAFYKFDMSLMECRKNFAICPQQRNCGVRAARPDEPGYILGGKGVSVWCGVKKCDRSRRGRVACACSGCISEYAVRVESQLLMSYPAGDREIICPAERIETVL